MPRDKTEAHEKIIAAVVKEFTEYGFENASMRRIASEVGLTVGALYRHFPNKEEMFAALVEPTINELITKYQEFCEQGYEIMKCGDVQQLWNESETIMLSASTIVLSLCAITSKVLPLQSSDIAC